MLLADISTFDGIAAHPLIVHLPVVLVPLAAFGALVALVRPSWRSWCLPLTAAFAAVGFVGVQLAIMSGEGLEELLDEESAAIERHAQIAEQARPIVLLFVLAAVAAAVLWHRLHQAPADEGASDAATPARPATLVRLAVPLMALSVLTGALSTVWIFRTGHSGAESVWKEESGGEGGEKGEDREGADHDDDRDRDAPSDSNRYEDDDD